MKSTKSEKKIEMVRKGRRIRQVLLYCVFIVFFHAFATHAQANILNVRVSLNLKNVTLKTVLQEIEQQTEYSFYYNENHIDSKQLVSINASEDEIADVLDEILKDCEYMVENKKIILLPSAKKNMEVAVSQQMKKVIGTVVDTNGEPLIGASVSLLGTVSGTITDIDGNFSLEITDPNGTLVISYIGYKDKNVKLSGESSIKVILEDDTQLLDEIVVVGYGTQRKKDLTGGITTLNSEKIDKIPSLSLSKRLQGQIAGLNVTTLSAQPNAADDENQTTIRVRGERSLSGNNEPLIVLDGIPFNGGLNQID
jgi:hypothetical protein